MGKWSLKVKALIRISLFIPKKLMPLGGGKWRELNELQIEPIRLDLFI
jgi:16S rRNA U516 pseudouridylate synthase RsuA-like enzyme